MAYVSKKWVESNVVSIRQKGNRCELKKKVSEIKVPSGGFEVGLPQATVDEIDRWPDSCLLRSELEFGINVPGYGWCTARRCKASELPKKRLYNLGGRKYH